MTKGCENGACIWAENGQFCAVLASASVPLDGRWPQIILYLRGVRDLNFLSEVQKGAMQEIMLRLLKDKDFGDKRFEETQEAIFDIMTAPFADKLREIARETSELAKDMQNLFGKHTKQVSSVASSVDQSLDNGVEPAALLANLRDALKGVVAKMEEDADALTSLSHKDSLTGLANRRSFDIFLNEAVESWSKDKAPLALIMFDIDHFKKFNDTYGHLVGDQVLRTLGAQISKVVMPLQSDTVGVLAARYGDEEFAVILCGEVAHQAVEIGEMIRKTLQKKGLLLRGTDGKILQSGIRVTVSVGVAMMWEGWQGVYQTNLVDCADKALYHAKRNGRNCTMRFEPDSKDGYVLASGK